MAGVQDETKHAISAMSPLTSCEVEKPQPQRWMPNVALVLVAAAVLEARDQPSTYSSRRPGRQVPTMRPSHYSVLCHWLRCLRRRRQRHKLTWRKTMRIAERWLPSPKLRHPYPDWRFDVRTRGGNPVR
jgi:hypothetical protein